MAPSPTVNIDVNHCNSPGVARARPLAAEQRQPAFKLRDFAGLDNALSRLPPRPGQGPCTDHHADATVPDMDAPREPALPHPDPAGRAAGRPLRLALFTGVYDYIKDGISITLNRLVEFLEREGVEVVVFAPTAKEAAFEHVGTLFPVPSIAMIRRPDYRLALGLGRPAREFLAAYQPDLFHIAVPDILGFQALRLARRQGIPVVGSFHTRYDTYMKYYSLSWLKPISIAYFRNFYGHCDHVYAPSPSMVEELRLAGIGHDVRIWSRGVDIQRFNPQNRSMAWRRSQGIADSDVVVTFVARLVLEKEVGTLIKSLQGLTQRGIRHRSLIVGDGPERADMEVSLPDTLFTGFLDGDELARAFASSDIFLFPSDTETFGNVTLEAMASGLPAVCADATGSRSLVVHGVTGFLATAKKPDEFIGYLTQLINDADLRATMAAAALERSKSYTWDNAFRELLANYRDAVEAKRREVNKSQR